MGLKLFMQHLHGTKATTANNIMVDMLYKIEEQNPNASEEEIDKALIMFCDFIVNPGKVPDIKNN